MGPAINIVTVPVIGVSAGGSKQTAADKGVVTLTTAYTMDSTATFDQNDPERRSCDENRYVNMFRDVLGVNLKSKWISPDDASSTAKWGAAIASGDVPDFAVVNDNLYKRLYEADLIADMTTIFPENASQGIKDYLIEESYKIMALDEKLMGFPLSNSSYLEGVLFVRQDWLDKAGLPVPQTIEDIISAARAFKAAKLNGDDTISWVLMGGIIIKMMAQYGIINKALGYFGMAFSNLQFSISTAAGLFKSALGCVLIVSSYRLAYSLSGYRIF